MAATPLPVLTERKVTRLWNRIKACFQPKDADLTAIAALTGTSGLLKKTAANTWALHTSTLVTIAGTGLSLGGSITAATLGGALTKIGTASKGASNLPIYLNAGTPTAVTSVGEAYLSWGGKNFSGSYGPIDAAMVSVLGANRSAFAAASGITVEYSRDSGSTWTDYGAAATTKTALFSGISAGLVIGKADSSNKATAAFKLRVTLSTSAAGIYTVLNKFVIYLSTNGSTGCTCTIQGRLQSNYEAGTETWVTFADKVGVSGWSGFNVINTSGITTYGNTKTSQYGQIRFIFEATGGSTQYNGLTLQYIQCFGGVGWTTPSTMASTGHMYTFDASKNVTFPAKVTASSFSGPLTGNVTGNCSGSSGSCTGNAASATTAAAITGYSFKTLSSAGPSGWTNAATDDKKIATMSMIAYWNGAYSGTSSNLAYCNKGAFASGAVTTVGTAATHAHSDYLTGLGWDSANNRLAWSKGGTTQTSITISYATVAGSANAVAWSNVSSKPTTLSGYGITDAKIANGVITLGGNSITPLTSHQSLASCLKLTGGTMSGDIVMASSASSAASSVGLKWSSGNAFIGSNTSGGLGIYATTIYLRPGSSKGSASSTGIVIDSTSATYNGNTMYHAGNLSLATLMGSSAKGGNTTPVYWTGSAWSTCTAFENARVASAASADKITNLTSTDQASSSTTWRRVWMCYSDNVNGRPAWSDGFVYQTSTATLKTKKFLAVSASGEQQEFVAQRTGGSSVALMVGTANANHGVYSITAAKWLIVSDASGNVTVNGNAASATTASKLSANAGSATSPVYFSGGVPVACTYTLGKSVPSDAVFTDHTYNFSGVTFYSGNQSNAEHNANNAVKNGAYYYSSNGPATSLGASTADGALFVQSYSDSWVGQIAQDYRNGRLFVRGKNNGTWQSWSRVALFSEIPSSLPANGGMASFATAIGSQSANLNYEQLNSICAAVNNHTGDTTKHITAAERTAWNAKSNFSGAFSALTGSLSSAQMCAGINNLTTGTSNPVDADYYVTQYAGGGTTTTTYHRRPHSALFAYIKGKLPSWSTATSKPAYTASEVGALASSHAASGVTSAKITNWDAAYSHISSTALHVQQEAWQTLNSGTPGIKYRRIGKMIAFKGYASITFSGNPSSPASVGTMASGYRPAAQTEFRCPVTVSGQSTLCFVQVQILTSGAVNLIVINGFGAPISSTVSWFADGLFFFTD